MRVNSCANAKAYFTRAWVQKRVPKTSYWVKVEVSFWPTDTWMGDSGLESGSFPCAGKNPFDRQKYDIFSCYVCFRLLSSHERFLFKNGNLLSFLLRSTVCMKVILMYHSIKMVPNCHTRYSSEFHNIPHHLHTTWSMKMICSHMSRGFSIIWAATSSRAALQTIDGAHLFQLLLQSIGKVFGRLQNKGVTGNLRHLTDGSKKVLLYFLLFSDVFSCFLSSFVWCFCVVCGLF